VFLSFQKLKGMTNLATITNKRLELTVPCFISQTAYPSKPSNSTALS
jgi:hypothetical protein